MALKYKGKGHQANRAYGTEPEKRIKTVPNLFLGEPNVRVRAQFARSNQLVQASAPPSKTFHPDHFPPAPLANSSADNLAAHGRSLCPFF
jgi:hypothetical protein